MNAPANKLLTPIVLKIGEEAPWPTDESVFHLVTADGLFLCRNHPFFVSSVPTRHWPQELAGHAPFLRLRYPRVPQPLFEQIIGFFAIIGEAHGAEAAVLLAWNTGQQRVEIIVPEQRSLVSSGWGGRGYPMSVEYEVPPLPAGWLLIGDVHSHVDEAAYASMMDEKDELHRPGLHIVVGRISKEPPEFHLEATVDGARFGVGGLDVVVEGYERRRIAEVPPEWIARVEVRRWTSQYGSVRIHPVDEPPPTHPPKS